MKRLWLLLGICLFTLYGCGLKEPFDLKDAEHISKNVEEDEYYLPGKTLTTLEKSEFEEMDTLYYVNDELALAQAIQYAYEHGSTTIAYQSEHTIDIDQTAKLLSIVNPFDLSLTQNDTTYTNAYKDVLYTAHHVEFKNLDTRYKEACDEAKRRVSAIIDEHMSMNEKIAAIHDDLVKNSIYDVDSQTQKTQTSSLFQAAGVLIDGAGVCTSYSRAFMIMAQAIGIPAVYVSSEDMNHGWNYVFDGEEWRYIDVTWDDPVPDQGEQISTKFLHLNTDAFFEEGTHTLRTEERTEVELVADSFF